jgi:hypothetical protein
MTNAISKVITIIGPSYFQPIADLVEKMVSKPRPPNGSKGTGFSEQGYAASLIILLVALLESFTSRLKYLKQAQTQDSPGNVAAFLLHFYPDLACYDELVEVFLIRNSASHNHTWLLDNRGTPNDGATIQSPIDIGFSTNKHYVDVVDTATRRTKNLELNASPSSLDREDVVKVFEVVWATLTFLNKKNFGDTPLSNDEIIFQGRRRKFVELLSVLRASL